MNSLISQCLLLQLTLKHETSKLIFDKSGFEFFSTLNSTPAVLFQLFSVSIFPTDDDDDDKTICHFILCYIQDNLL